MDSLKLIDEINRPILLDNAINDYLGYFGYIHQKNKSSTPALWRDNWAAFHILCSNIKIYLELKKYDEVFFVIEKTQEYIKSIEIYNSYSYLLISGMFKEYIDIIERTVTYLPKHYYAKMLPLLNMIYSYHLKSLKTYIHSEKTTMAILLTSVIDSKYLGFREEAMKMLLYLNTVLENESSFFETKSTHDEIKKMIQSIIQDEVNEGIKKYNEIKNSNIETPFFNPEFYVQQLRIKIIPRLNLIYLEQKFRLKELIEYCCPCPEDLSSDSNHETDVKD